jgi:hypothetical protein
MELAAVVVVVDPLAVLLELDPPPPQAESMAAIDAHSVSFESLA